MSEPHVKPDETRCWSCPVPAELHDAYRRLYELVVDSAREDVRVLCEQIYALELERER